MEDIVYNALKRYFTHLKQFGYMPYTEVDKLLTLILIREFTYNDFRGYIKEHDYKLISKALYCLFGKTCLIPYPEFCNNSGMETLHIGSISELVYRVKRLEESDNIGKILETVEKVQKIEDSLNETKVVKVKQPQESQEK